MKEEKENGLMSLPQKASFRGVPKFTETEGYSLMQIQDYI